MIPILVSPTSFFIYAMPTGNHPSTLGGQTSEIVILTPLLPLHMVCHAISAFSIEYSPFPSRKSINDSNSRIGRSL